MPLIAMLTILTILFSLGLVGGRTMVTLPEIQPVYVKSGDTLDLTCEQSDGFNVRWYKADRITQQYNMIDSNNDTGVIILSHIIGKQVVQLIKYNVTLNDEGSYRCAVLSGYDMPYAVQVYVLQVDERPGLVTHLGNSSTIGCVVSTVEMVRVEAYWTRNDMDLEGIPNKFTQNFSHGVNNSEFTLTVKNVGEADVGIYQCNIKLNNGNKFIHNVNLYSYPQVKPMGRSKNLVAGLNLELVCKVWGWPLPNVTWDFEEGRPLNWSDGRISVTSNGTLKIENVVATDRAVYVCTAFNEINKTRHQTSTSILVRVKVGVDGVCNEAGIRKCAAIVPDSQKFKFAYTREELEASCRLADEFVNCINRTTCDTLEEVQALAKGVKRITDYICGQRKEEFLDNAQCFSSHKLETSGEFCLNNTKRQPGTAPCETASRLISCIVQTVNICCGKKAFDLVDEFLRVILPQNASFFIPIPSDCQFRSDLVVGVLPLCATCATGGSNSVQFHHGSQFLAMVIIFLSLLRKDWL